MNATLTQPVTLTTATDPKVIYDPVNKVITATVIVSLAPDQDDIAITAAPITIPKDTWTLFWDLVVDTPGLVAEFANPGIIIANSVLPARVAVVSGPSGDAAQWTSTLRNQVIGANAFNYNIAVAWSMSASDVVPKIKVHDPTIAVTTDPLG